MTMAGRIAECPISYRQVWYWKDRKHFVLGARSSQLQTWPWTGRIMELHLQWWVSFWCGPSPCCWLDRQKYLSTDCSQLARTALRKLLKGKIRLVERGRLSPPPAPRPHASNTHNCEHLTHNACSRCLLQWRPTNRRRSLFKFFSVRQILPPYIKLLSTAYGQRHAKKKNSDWTGITVYTRCSINIGYIPLRQLICRGDTKSSRVGGIASALLHNSACDHALRSTGIATVLQVPASDTLVPYVSH